MVGFARGLGLCWGHNILVEAKGRKPAQSLEYIDFRHPSIAYLDNPLLRNWRSTGTAESWDSNMGSHFRTHRTSFTCW